MQKQIDAIALLEELNEIRAIGGKETKTTAEMAVDSFRKFLMLVASAAFLLLLSLAGWQKFIFNLPREIKVAAIFIACLSMALPILAMLVDIAFGAFQFVRLKKEAFRTLLLEMKHDQASAEAILKFERKVLIAVKGWLETKCSRIRSRIALFFGGSEKIALISLAGFAWVTYKEVFNGKVPESIPSLGDNPIQFVILLVIAFFTGLSIGAMLLSQQLRRYQYHIEIIDMALKKKSERKAG